MQCQWWLAWAQVSADYTKVEISGAVTASDANEILLELMRQVCMSCASHSCLAFCGDSANRAPEKWCAQRGQCHSSWMFHAVTRTVLKLAGAGCKTGATDLGAGRKHKAQGAAGVQHEPACHI